MTDLFIHSATCQCEPGDPSNKLGIVEGHTAVWVCQHTDVLIQKNEKKWVLQK